MYDVLKEAWTRGFTTKSDFARHHADYVACAASRGWLTTRIDPHEEAYSNVWQITAIGLMALEHKYYATQKQA
jgi:hypothetical protein